MASADIELLSLEQSSHDVRSGDIPNKESNSTINQDDAVLNGNETNDSTTTPTTDCTEHNAFLGAIYPPNLSASMKGTLMFGVFTSLVMVIGIIIVYYTSPKPSGRVCTFVLKSAAQNSISDDSHPYSIAAGDFNNDGLPDIVVPNSGTNNVAIFIRRDQNSFIDQQTYSTGTDSVPYAVAIGDFNKDQRIDIVVANFGTHCVGLFLGIGNGTFTSQKTYSTGSSRPRYVAVGDFNNDTQLDLVVVNYGTNSIGVLFGNGNGSFTTPITYSTGFDSVPYSLAVVDLNRDNILDIVVANSGTNNVGIFFGIGGGLFATQMTLPAGLNSRPYSIAIGDFNNDTHMDIVVVCFESNNINVFLAFLNGTFTRPTPYSTGDASMPRSIVIGDFDNDGKLDIVVANYGTASIGVLFGIGNGYFQNQMIFYTSSGANPYSFATADFNNDTRLDIAVVNYDHNYVDLILTYRNYRFLKQVTYRTTGMGSAPRSIALGDFNNDHRLDIVVANYELDNIIVLLNHATGIFLNRFTYSIETGSTPTAVAVGDLNNDTHLDIVVAIPGWNSIGVFLGDGNGTFGSQKTYFIDSYSSPCSIGIGDFNNDQRLDIIVVSDATNALLIYIGDGNGNFALQGVFSTDYGSQPAYVAIGDFNNDTKLDLVVANYGSDNVAIFLGNGDGTLQRRRAIYTGAGSAPLYVAVADLNNDHFLDIVVVNNGNNNIGIFLGQADGTFTNQTTYSTGDGSSPHCVCIADFNNDTLLDIAVTNYQTSNLGFFFGYGNGRFSSQLIYSLEYGSGPYPVVVGDLNNDNRTDIVIGNYNASSVDIFFGYGNGSYLTEEISSTPTANSTPGNSFPNCVAVGDVNDDTCVDVIVVNSVSNIIDVFLGNGDGTLATQTTYSTGINSSPKSVSLGDFNGDRRLDIVVANSGTSTIGVWLGYGNGSFASQQTYSTGGSSQPAAVAVGDVNNDTRLDIIVANYGTSNIGVLLGNGDGTFSSQITFSTGIRSYPRALAIADFNHDSHLDVAVIKFGPDNFGVFLGVGDGSFSDQTTYSSGPGTGPYSITVGDLNNDGHLDIVITVYYTQSVNVYLGDENGTFIGGATYSTGGASRPYSVAVVDINNDNRMDIVVGNSYADNIIIFFGNGDGSFSNPTTYSTGNVSFPVSVAIGDLNSDGLIDVIVANYYSNTIGIFIGSSYMNGIRENTYSTGSAPQPRALALGDFNHDTKLDISMAIYGLGNVGVLLGQSNGNFPSQTMYSTGDLSYPTSIALGDINNDSQIDVIVANSATNNVGILYGYANGSFGRVQIYPLGSHSNPQSVAVGDFNNDKKLDIAVANTGTNSVVTLLKYDTGAFRNQITYRTGIDSTSKSVSTGDFNKDSWLDFVVVNSGNNNIGVFLSLGNGSFVNQTTYSTGSPSSSALSVVADLNNDTCLDIIVNNAWGDNIGVFLGFCNGTFTTQTTYSTGLSSGPLGIAIADLNNDGRLDIATVLQFTNKMGVLYGHGDGTFSNITTYSTGENSSPVSVDVADFNGDHRLDIVVANYGSNNVGIFYGNDNNVFSNIIPYSTGTNSLPISLVVADLNNDGRMDIAVTNSGTDNVGVFFANNNGNFTDPMILSTGQGSAPHGITIGDFNNDKQLDIAVTNYGSSTFGIFLGCINGTFFSQLTYSTGDSSQPFYLAVGDFNNDTRKDVIVANSATNSVGLFLGYVNEDFLVAPAYSTGQSSQPSSIATGDFDKDSRLDIVVANRGTHTIMILFGSGYGTFISQTIYSVGNGSQPSGVVVGDLNNDTCLDIVVANAGTNTIGVFLGNGTGTFSNQITYFTGVSSLPHSVVILDFDNDGYLDIAVANYGSSNVGVFFGYGNGSFGSQMIFGSGFGSHPFALAIGDVNKDNLTDIVATNNGYGNIDILMKTC